MTIEYRSDRGQLVRYEPTPGGGVRVDAALTKTGVFEYRTADGKVSRELKGPRSVLDAKALASLKDAPVTVDHPAAFVDASSWKNHSVGHVSADPAPGEDPERPGTIVGSLVVSDAEAIAAIDAGQLKEVSLGYYATIVEQAGTFDGQEYDRVQLDPVYNHVALGGHDWGRLGPEVSLRINRCDSVTQCEGSAGMLAIQDCAPANSGRTKEENMNPLVKLEGGQVRVDGVIYSAEQLETASQALARAIEHTRTNAASELAPAIDALGETSALVLEQAQELARLRAELADARSYDVSALVAERAALIARVNSIAPSFEVGDEMSNADVIKGALEAAGIEIKADATEDYLRGVLDHIKAEPVAAAEDLSALAVGVADSSESLVQAAERKRNEQIFSAWRRAKEGN